MAAHLSDQPFRETAAEVSLSINLVDALAMAGISFFFVTVGGAVVNWLFNRTGRKAETTRRKAEEEDRRKKAEEREIEREELLAEARARAQQTALESAATAFQSVKAQCDECNRRLLQAEERQARAEQRMYDAEQRERAADEREGKMRVALRTIIRVIDTNDPTEVAAAINAARELM